MNEESLKTADFFEENPYDPIDAAAGGKTSGSRVPKRKAGFYLAIALIERFDRKFYELKLSGLPVANKSALLEQALEFALEDLDRESDSLLRKRLQEGSPRT
jgi:hypothetical protein